MKRGAKQVRLSRLLLLAMTVIPFLVIVGAAYLEISHDYREFQRSAARLREDYIISRKQLIKNEVEKVVDYIGFNWGKREERLRTLIKSRTDEAHAIATALYGKNRGMMSDRTLRKVVFDALRPIRFNNGRGYYFATGMDGVEILFADRPELEGTNLLDMRDTRGAYVIRDMIDLVKRENEGFYTYQWTKPNAPGRDFPKIAYIKYFAPFDCFIGTGEYLDEFEQDIKQEVLERIRNIRFGEEGYVFVVSYEGVTLMNDVQPELIGINIWEMTDPYGVKVIQEERRAVEKPGGDFISYHWRNPLSKEIAAKISFLKGFPKWQWMIGAGFYADRIEKEIAAGQKTIRRNMKRELLFLGLLFIGIVATIHLLSLFLSMRIQKEFGAFSTFFKAMETGGAPIDREMLAFQEFAVLADSANNMLLERKRAEKELDESRTRYSQLFDNMAEGMAVYRAVDDGRDFVIVDINRTGMLIGKVNLEDVVGRRITEVFPGVERIGLLDVIRRVWKTGRAERHPVVEYKDERISHWVENYVYKLPSGLVATLYSDTSEKQKAEQARKILQDQLQQAMKMEAVGRLAGGVAHDFNNLLTGIIGNVSLARMDLSPDDPLNSTLEDVKRAADSAAALTRQLLAFSRKQVIEPKVVDINDLVSNLQKMLKRIIGEDIELRTVPAAGPVPVKVDPGQFEQILINLVVNARDAMPNGGRLVIETSDVDLDGEYCLLHPNVKPGGFVMISVSDTGIGMSAEVKEHLFEPFFTTKPKGRGTGLGLATIYGTVEQAGGHIDVHSETGKGTTFRIYLPRTVEKSEKPERVLHAEELPRGKETILLVEDERIVREFAARILDRLGYAVLQEPDGAAALARSKAHEGPIDLLLTDIVMPGMNGRDLAERLKDARPGMRVLFTSGYPEDIIGSRGVIDPGVEFIGKPYSPQALARKIREVLDKARQNQGNI